MSLSEGMEVFPFSLSVYELFIAKAMKLLISPFPGFVPVLGEKVVQFGAVTAPG